MVRRSLTLSLTICAALGLFMRFPTQQNRRDPQILSSRHPCEHVDPRGSEISTVAPMTGVFNNLVLFKQDHFAVATRR